MKDKKLVVGIILLAVIIIGISAVFLQRPSTTPTRRVVVYAYNDRITGIDPSLEDDTGLVVLGSIYETLTYYDSETQEVKPRLATSWEFYEDGTIWIFHLRRNVVFHDGTPFNATAVKASIERAINMYRTAGKGLGYIWDAVEEIEVVDDYTVKFKLSYPQRLDLMASASYAAYIFSPSALSKSGAADYYDSALVEWFNAGNAVGTGPYRLSYYDPTREIRLEKFSEWWGWREVNNPDAPEIVIIKIIIEPVAQYSGLLSGEIDIACSIPRENIKELLNRGFKVQNVTTFHNFILFFNTKRYPTNISNFRLAIAHALDLPRIVRDALQGYGRVASGVLPYGFPGHIENLRYEYSTSKARDNLKEAGVSLPVSVELVYQAGYEETERFAEIFRSTMFELGINVVLNPQDWARLKDIAKGVWENPDETPHLILADWWPTVPSAYDILYAMFHSDSKEWNFAGYENRAFDELIEAAWMSEGANYTYALELYENAQRILFEQAVGVGLWDDIRPYLYSDRVDLPREALNPLYMYVIRFEIVKVKP
ncbi:MAG: ABC transporter substrate-binding protein [Desulfurococcaceae archaeon]